MKGTRRKEYVFVLDYFFFFKKQFIPHLKGPFIYLFFNAKTFLLGYS